MPQITCHTGPKRWVPLILLLLACPTLVTAVSLGNIEVASRLGEPFVAAIPLRLGPDEKISDVFVELADPGEYHTLEIFRHEGLNAIRSDVISDSRGPRVEMSSDSPVRMPFFNMVLKLRYGHATHFKKFPIALDLPKALARVGESLPADLPWKNPDTTTPKAATPKTAPVLAKNSGKGIHLAAAATKRTGNTPETKGAKKFKPFDGWARSDRYGPIVFGDTLSTVARRLRINGLKFSMPQVMVALFRKNSNKFSQNNINLLAKGAFLDVPKAAEVAAITPQEAKKILKTHARRWQALKQQPKFEAVAKAQKNRYVKHVSVGEVSMALPTASEAGTAKQTPQKKKKEDPDISAALNDSKEALAEVENLQQRNAVLEQRLIDTETRLNVLAKRINHEIENSNLKRMEKKINQLQSDLQRLAAHAPAEQILIAGIQISYILAATIALLLIIILFLLLRQRSYVRELTSQPVAPPVQDRSRESVAEQMPAQAVVAQTDPEEMLPETIAREHEPEAEEPVIESIPQPKPAERTTDANLDYLAEAEGYLRYGMEEAAIQNARMAITQRRDNEEAHSKLVNMLIGGDQQEFELAVSGGRSALSGDALQRFESEIKRLQSEQDALTATSSASSQETETGTEQDTSIAIETDEVLIGSPDQDVMRASDTETSKELDEIEWPDFHSEMSPDVGKTEITSFQELLSEDEEDGKAAVNSANDFLDFDISDQDRTMQPADEDNDETGEEQEPSAPNYQKDARLDLSQETLQIDLARSLIASGSIDEAEASFKESLVGGSRGPALLGLAEIAGIREDRATAQSLLAKAEPLLDKSNRDWFDRLTHKLRQGPGSRD